ncbi:MAG: collagen-like protein, partial [Nanoarchaeota archaeon]|nr:collagen-like protein [Nanoarchaeota archaeon]
MGNFIEKFNFFTNIFILLILVFGGIIWADSNGVWNRAEDIRGGIFGGDEQLNTVNYTFINPVYFNESVNAKEYCDINGTNCKNIANIAGGGDSYWEKLENDTYYLNGSMIIKSYGVIPYTCNKTYEGGMFYLNVTKMIYFCDGTNWNEYRGPEGPTGSTGSTGPRGVRGFTGSAGLDCSVSGTCAQLCIGTDCKNAWPSGGG